MITIDDAERFVNSLDTLTVWSERNQFCTGWEAKYLCEAVHTPLFWVNVVVGFEGRTRKNADIAVFNNTEAVDDYLYRVTRLAIFNRPTDRFSEVDNGRCTVVHGCYIKDIEMWCPQWGHTVYVREDAHEMVRSEINHLRQFMPYANECNARDGVYLLAGRLQRICAEHYVYGEIKEALMKTLKEKKELDAQAAKESI